MKSKNPAAVALAKMGKGVSRKFTVAEIAKRRLRLAAARLKRWPRKPQPAKKGEKVKVIKLTKKQQALKKAHGTPFDFAMGCHACVPGYVSYDEAEAAAQKYRREWNAAGLKKGKSK